MFLGWVPLQVYVLYQMFAVKISHYHHKEDIVQPCIPWMIDRSIASPTTDRNCFKKISLPTSPSCKRISRIKIIKRKTHNNCAYNWIFLNHHKDKKVRIIYWLLALATLNELYRFSNSWTLGGGRDFLSLEIKLTIKGLDELGTELTDESPVNCPKRQEESNQF